MSSRLTKKSFVSLPGCLVNTPCLESPAFAPSTRRPPDEDGHLRRRQLQQLRPVHHRLLRRHELQLLAVGIVAEAVGTRFERREAVDVGLLLRRVHAARREGHLHVDAGILGGLFDRRAAAENDQVGKRNLLAELFLDRFELLQDRFELGGLVDLPILLRAQANARAVRAAALVGAAERRRRRPGRRDELRHRQAGAEDLRLQRSDVLSRRSADDPQPGSGPARSASPSARAGRGSARRGPMSRCVSLNQARANASANWSGCS